MKRQRADPSDSTTGETASAAAGRAMNPASLPADKPAPEPVDPEPIPIGLPVSETEYRRLKEAARKGTKPPASCAQEDPTALSEPEQKGK
jgi:hypothetical protein